MLLQAEQLHKMTSTSLGVARESRKNIFFTLFSYSVPKKQTDFDLMERQK